MSNQTPWTWSNAVSRTTKAASIHEELVGALKEVLWYCDYCGRTRTPEQCPNPGHAKVREVLAKVTALFTEVGE